MTYPPPPLDPNAQSNWRYCDKCHVMFFNGFTGKGKCPGGGGHNAQGYNFKLYHDRAPGPNQQNNWRYCDKCFGMFFDGYPGKGVCPSGGGHHAQGYNFVLGHLPVPGDPTGVQEVTFSQQVLTPSGTALGGGVDLTLRSDGSYHAHFHMHNSGVINYEFTVRAVFNAANGLAFALQHGGRVDGSPNPLANPRRTDNFDIEGFNILIKLHWADVKNGKFTVSKDYGASGVAGFIQDVAQAIVGVAAGAVSGTAGAVIALGNEMVSVFNSLEQSGTFGVIAGVAVFASGGGLVMAVTTGVEVGAMTKLLIKNRPVTEAEYKFAAQVFGGSLPPPDKLILTNLEGLGGRAFTMPGGAGNIFLNVGAYCYDHPLIHVDKPYPTPGQLFIHELTHAWQIHNSTFVPGWICSGLIIQTRNTFGDNTYKYAPPDGPTTRWSDFNLEQQGAIVDQWFGGNRANGTGMPMNSSDPYFHYIRDNIRPGRT